MKINLKLLVLLILLNNLKRISVKINIVDENGTQLKNVEVYGKSVVSGECVILNSYCGSWVCFTNVPSGNVEFVVYKEGFYIKSFCACITENCEFTVCLCRKRKNRIYGVITNNFNDVVENAVVVLYRVIKEDVYVPLKSTRSDFSGEYNFIDIPKGTYIVKAIK